MKYLLSTVLFVLLLNGCKENESKDINIKFSSREAFDSQYLKRNENSKAELIISKRTNQGITVTVDKYVTGSVKYYGKAKVINDSLYLYYWIDMDPYDISAVRIPKKFKYELHDVKFKGIKFEFLGNKFDSLKK